MIRDIMIFLFVMMILCAGGLYFKNKTRMETESTVPINPAVTLLEKEVEAVKTIEKPTIDPETDLLAPLASTESPYKPPPTPREIYNPRHMVQ